LAPISSTEMAGLTNPAGGSVIIPALNISRPQAKTSMYPDQDFDQLTREPPSATGRSPEQVLHEVFGYESFRPLQGDIVQEVVGGGDALVLMPTGGGKSLCYQVPALV